MDGMNSEQIERVFGALGRIEQKIDSAATAVITHAAHDETVQRALFERIEKLQLSHARQKGFFSALAAAGSAIGAGLGYVIQRWMSH